MSRMEPLLKEIDRIFSREVLGSIFVGGALAEVVTQATELYVPDDEVSQIIVWSTYLVIAIVLFAWWERIEAAKERAQESAGESRESFSETVSEKVESTKESVEETKESVAEDVEEMREE